jgi:hypothetical protein
MIEDAINRLAAAIEAHTAAIIDSRRQLAEVGTTAKPEPEPKPKPKNNPKTEPDPEPVLGTRAISRKDLTEFAMSLSRQDTAYGAKIKATLAKYGAPTISALAEDKIGAVFADLNNMAHADAREPGEEG